MRLNKNLDFVLQTAMSHINLLYKQFTERFEKVEKRISDLEENSVRTETCDKSKSIH
jgi:hypothetical protein